MADNVNITEGSGKIVATDDVSSVHFQKVKVDLGADGASSPLGVGQQAKAASIPVTLATDEDTVNVLLTAGTAEIGKLAAGTASIGVLGSNSGVDIGDVDVLSIAAGDNNIGNVDIVTLPVAAQDTNYFSATVTSADASTATQVKAKTAAKKIYVTSLAISVGATAIEVQLQSDNGTPQVVMEEMFFAANGGIAISSASERVPLFVVNTNEDLDVITSAAGDVTVLVSGYVV